MGLDITAYSKVEKVDVEVDEDNYPVDESAYDDYVRAWAMGRRGQHDQLEDGKFYSVDEAYGFPAGSYGGYNQWREQLAKMAGYPLTEYREDYSTRRMHAAACWKGATGPFSELIMFADNQGVLGASVCAKLAKDFAEHEAAARTFAAAPEGDSDFIVSYLDWKQAFELAADGGMVDFH